MRHKFPIHTNSEIEFLSSPSRQMQAHRLRERAAAPHLSARLADDGEGDGGFYFRCQSVAQVALAYLVLSIAAVAIGTSFALLLYIAKAHAHQTVAGWEYDYECCSDDDCFQLPAEAVKVTPKGYLWDGETIAFTDPRIRISQDQFYHGCKQPIEAGRVLRRCLYVPQGGV